MNTIKGRPLHQRLLIASYILGSVSTLLGALAAVGATLERNELQYPPVNGPTPSQPPKPSEPRRYFDQ